MDLNPSPHPSPCGRGSRPSLPRLHRKKALHLKGMDCQVKPGNDGAEDNGRGYHPAAVAGGSAIVSTSDRSSLREAWSISNPTTSPLASGSTTSTSTISRTSAPGAL